MATRPLTCVQQPKLEEKNSTIQKIVINSETVSIYRAIIVSLVFRVLSCVLVFSLFIPRNQPTVTSDVINPSVAETASASLVNSTARVEVGARSSASSARRSRLSAASARLGRAATSIRMKSRCFGRRHQHEVHDEADVDNEEEEQPSDRQRLHVHGTVPIQTRQRRRPHVSL